MSDTPESTPSQEPAPPRSAAIPPAAPPPPPQQAWYSGPYPPPGIGAQPEGTWRMVWRTALKGTVAAGCFGTGLVLALFIPLLVLAGILAAVTGDDDGDGYKFVYGDDGSRNKLLSIPIRGVILGEEPDDAGGLFGSLGIVYGYTIKEKLIEAAEDSSINGVILELETPGGTIFGSIAIADGVREYQRRTGKPVLAFVAGISASGGMYAMAPANRILADHGSLLGSIGVTMGAFEYWNGLIATEGGLFGGGVTTSEGIEFQPITAGRGKDIGAPYRRLTDEERRVLQQGVDNAYADFVRHVSEARDIPEATIRDRIGALVYDNRTAEELGLIDGTANREAAYSEAARLAGLEGDDWQVVREESDLGILGGLFGIGGDEKPGAAEGATRGICFPAYTILAYHGDPAALCAGR